MKERSTKRLSRDDRREQIIQAALLVFIEKGYSQTTTLEIAKAADISEVTLFRNFSSKREIFYAGIDPILTKEMSNETSKTSTEYASIDIEHIILDRIKFLEVNRGIVKLILNENIVNQNNENYITKMVINLEELLKERHIDKDIDFIVRLLVGSFLSFLYQPETSEIQVKNYAKRIVEIINRDEIQN